jgi:hypothetical protein
LGTEEREEQRLEAAQMEFLRHLLGIAKMHKGKNQCITGKNGITGHSKGNKTVPEKVATTRTEGDTNRIPKQALRYRPKGRRDIGRPRKRWRDQLHFEDQEKGNTPNPS